MRFSITETSRLPLPFFFFLAFARTPAPNLPTPQRRGTPTYPSAGCGERAVGSAALLGSAVLLSVGARPRGLASPRGLAFSLPKGFSPPLSQGILLQGPSSGTLWRPLPPFPIPALFLLPFPPAGPKALVRGAAELWYTVFLLLLLLLKQSPSCRGAGRPLLKRA